MIVSQSDVQTMVLNALYWDLAVPPHRVKVEVENGWVTMSGMVDRPYQRTCANRTRAGFLAWTASSIKFGSRRSRWSKGPLATRAGAIALTAYGSWKWAPEIEIARAKLLRRSALGAGPELLWIWAGWSASRS